MATNLQFIKSETITSPVSTLDITDVFSANYDVYQITANGLSTAGSTTYCAAKLINSSGSVLSDGSYDDAYLSLKTNATYGESRNVGITYWQEFFGDADGGAEGSAGANYIFNPFNTAYTFNLRQTFHAQGGLYRAYKGIGVYKQTTSCTGIHLMFTELSQDVTGGTISVYGVK
jgi:hypothetical protein